MRRPAACLLALAVLFAAPTRAADGPIFDRTEDVIYGRKHGMALTLDVFKPRKDANGLGIIFVVSGGWFSAHEAIPLGFVDALVLRGYTVFAVCHGSQPRFTIPEAIDDIDLAVHFIRFHARDYGIDPAHLGICGQSAGGHLSLMQGMAGDSGEARLLNPAKRASSRVQAVAVFFPPTDFLNYGRPGEIALGSGVLAPFRAAFDFHEFDPATKRYDLITDEAKRRAIGRRISPYYSVDKGDPPTLIFHGDADKLVPIQQSERLVARLKEVGVEARLIVKPGQAHGWPDMHKDMEAIADWFDAHLKPGKDHPAP